MISLTDEGSIIPSILLQVVGKHVSAIADNAYFAQYAKFPNVPGVTNKSSLDSPNSPWILYGGSLAGAETAFSLHDYGGDGGILWAGIAASGTTKALLEYPQW